jgi:hypothetical protein
LVDQQTETPSARRHALAVLRIRGTALALAVLPAAVAAVLLAGSTTGQVSDGWDPLRWTVTGIAVLVLALAVGLAVVIARAEPALTPSVPVAERSAPGLYAVVHELADRLGVPAPSAVALTPDCDSWLEDRPGAGAPVLVIGSPFLWWMRVEELRALLAPVVAGTGPSAHPDIAAARRFVRGLDAAVGAADGAGRRGLGVRFAGGLARLMLRSCGPHTARMEQGVAAAAADRAQHVDYGVRIAAQEQVGLAYAGWDRLLTRVALPAWRAGRWPSRLDAGVVEALTELSRRDRLAAEGFARLGERPACELLEEPGLLDEAVSLLAAQLFHGAPAREAVTWSAYPKEVVDLTWRTEAARLFGALDALEATAGTEAAAAGPDGGRCVGRVIDRLARGDVDVLAARVGSDVRQAEDVREPAAVGGALSPREAAPSPLGLPLRPPRADRELLADHVTAVACCAAVDLAGAAPGLDWLDGPALLVGGERRTDLTGPVLDLVEDGDPRPLRAWLDAVGIAPDGPLRLHRSPAPQGWRPAGSTEQQGTVRQNQT